MSQPNYSRLTVLSLAVITLALIPPFVFAQQRGGAPAAAAPGVGGIATLTPAQTTAITTMDQAIKAQTAAATAARTAFIAAAFADPVNEADLKAKLAQLTSAELALANARADGFIKLQASANKLDAGQVAMLIARVERTDRTGGPVAGTQERPMVAQFDADKNARLDTAERARAVEFINSTGAGQGFRGGGGRCGNRPPASPGVKLTPADVKNHPDAPLYDAAVLRTFFIELENPNWEAELVAFNNTDVEVPAKVKVDGKTYPDVGIHFRGNSSFGVGNGYKRSLNLTFDFVHKNQAIFGYRALNFLNANDDPTFLRTVLSLHIARQYMPAPKANLVRVVINGENWGIYANAQQFNKEFLSENFKTIEGTRWKVPQGGGGGLGGFRFVDQDANSYRPGFHIKSGSSGITWLFFTG